MNLTEEQLDLLFYNYMEDIEEEKRIRKNLNKDNTLQDKDYNEDEIESYHDPDFDKEWNTLEEEQYNPPSDTPDINNLDEWEEV